MKNSILKKTFILNKILDIYKSIKLHEISKIDKKKSQVTRLATLLLAHPKSKFRISKKYN